MNSLRKKTLKGLQWSLLGTAGNAVLQMVVMVVITRLIAPAEFGVFAMAQLFVQFAAFFTNFGVGTAILRKAELSDDYIAAGFWSNILISSFIAILMFALAPLSVHLLDSPKIVIVVRFLAINFIINGLSTVSNTLLQRQMRFGYLALVTIGTYAMGYGFIGIPLALRGYGVYALVGCMVAQSVIRFILLFGAERHRIQPSFDGASYRDILSFGGQSSIAGCLSFLGSSVDRFMLGHWGSAELLGIYSRSSQLINYPIQFLASSVTRVLFPGFSSIQQDQKHFRRTYCKSLEMMAIVFLPIACLASLISKDLLFVAFGETWVSGWPALVAYACVAPMSVLGMMGMMVNDIIGKQVFRIRIHLEALLIFVIGIGWGVKYGIGWVALFVVLGNLYRLVRVTLLMCRLLEMPKSIIWHTYNWAFLVAALVGSVVGLIMLIGGALSPFLRMSISLACSGGGIMLLLCFVRVPPILKLLDIAKSEFPLVRPYLRWVKQ